MRLIKKVILSLAFFVYLPGSAYAGWIQSLGQSERCIALGGACVAKAHDFGAYYYNPAGAMSFTSPTLGGSILIFDTRNGDLIDSAGNHDTDRSNTEEEVLLAPTFAGYLPLNEHVTLGLGVPFAFSADWTNDSGIHRYNMSDESLFVFEVSPNAAFKVTEQLRIGAGLNVVALKQLRTETLIPDSFGAALPPALGGMGVIIPTTPTSPTIGSLTFKQKRRPI